MYAPTCSRLTVPELVIGTLPSHESSALAPGSLNDPRHSTLTRASPFSVISGGGLETWTPADAVLFSAGLGSAVVEVAVAEAAIAVASGVEQSPTRTVSVNAAEASTSSEALVHCTWPVPSGSGVVQVHPAGTDSDSNRARAGIALVSETFAAGKSSLVGESASVVGSP